MTVHHQEQGLVCWTSGSKRATWPKRDRRRLKSGYGYSALAFTCTLRCKRTHHRHQVHGWYHQSAEWSCLLHSTNSALLDPALERSHLPPAYCHWYQQCSPRQLQRTHIYIYTYIYTHTALQGSPGSSGGGMAEWYDVGLQCKRSHVRILVGQK